MNFKPRTATILRNEPVKSGTSHRPGVRNKIKLIRSVIDKKQHKITPNKGQSFFERALTKGRFVSARSKGLFFDTPSPLTEEGVSLHG